MHAQEWKQKHTHTGRPTFSPEAKPIDTLYTYARGLWLKACYRSSTDQFHKRPHIDTTRHWEPTKTKVYSAISHINCSLNNVEGIEFQSPVQSKSRPCLAHSLGTFSSRQCLAIALTPYFAACIIRIYCNQLWPSCYRCYIFISFQRSPRPVETQVLGVMDDSVCVFQSRQADLPL